MSLLLTQIVTILSYKSICNDLHFFNQTLCRINVTLTQISKGKNKLAFYWDFREVYCKWTYNLELSKLKNMTEKKTVSEQMNITKQQNQKFYC